MYHQYSQLPKIVQSLWKNNTSSLPAEGCMRNQLYLLSHDALLYNVFNTANYLKLSKVS